MANAFLTDLSATELKERYARVRYVFTDLDGTMMGPGSCVLKNAAGEPSVDFAATLVELARAGIEVIPCSGRNRSMLHEDTRVLGLNSYIARWAGSSCSTASTTTGSTSPPTCPLTRRTARPRTR